MSTVWTIVIALFVVAALVAVVPWWRDRRVRDLPADDPRRERRVDQWARSPITSGRMTEPDWYRFRARGGQLP